MTDPSSTTPRTRPYTGDEYLESLRDGREISLRAIRPEDTPALRRLFESLTPEDRRSVVSKRLRERALAWRGLWVGRAMIVALRRAAHPCTVASLHAGRPQHTPGRVVAAPNRVMSRSGAC